jgi:hypothetical protein
VLVAAVAVGALALVLAGWAGVRLARDRPVILRQLIGGGVVELALVVQTVVALVLTLTGHPLADAVTFWGYLVVALLLLPLAAVWAFADRTRWSSAVLLVAALTLLVMEVRLVQLWQHTAVTG